MPAFLILWTPYLSAEGRRGFDLSSLNGFCLHWHKQTEIHRQ